MVLLFLVVVVFVDVAVVLVVVVVVKTVIVHGLFPALGESSVEMCKY